MDEQNQNNQYRQDSNSQYSGNQSQQSPNAQYNNYPYGQEQGAPNSSQYGQNANNQYNNSYGQNSNAQYNNQYGSNANNYQDYTMYSPNQSIYNEGGSNSANGLQIAGLICGILGICLSCCIAVPGLVLGITGIICSIIGNKDSKHGVGTAGLVCSIIALICGIIMAVYWIKSFEEAFRLLSETGFY